MAFSFGLPPEFLIITTVSINLVLTLSLCPPGWHHLSSTDESQAASCVWTSNHKKSWDDARLKCQQENADLITITSQHVLNYVETKLLTKKTTIWVGYKQFDPSKSKRGWQWVQKPTGQRNKVVTWKNKEPSGGDGCASVWKKVNNNKVMMVGDTCAALKKYFCQKATTTATTTAATTATATTTAATAVISTTNKPTSVIRKMTTPNVIEEVTSEMLNVRYTSQTTPYSQSTYREEVSSVAIMSTPSNRKSQPLTSASSNDVKTTEGVKATVSQSDEFTTGQDIAASPPGSILTTDGIPTQETTSSRVHIISARITVDQSEERLTQTPSTRTKAAATILSTSDIPNLWNHTGVEMRIETTLGEEISTITAPNTENSGKLLRLILWSVCAVGVVACIVVAALIVKYSVGLRALNKRKEESEKEKEVHASSYETYC